MHEDLWGAGALGFTNRQGHSGSQHVAQDVALMAWDSVCQPECPSGEWGCGRGEGRREQEG